MFCPHCGKAIANVTNFCPYCGTNLAKADSPNEGSTPTNLENRSDYASDNSSSNTKNGITSRLVRVGISLLGGGMIIFVIWGIVSNSLLKMKEPSEINTFQKDEQHESIYQSSRTIDPTEFDGVFANLDNENELLEIEWADWSLIFNC